jgi:hypothetical protein
MTKAESAASLELADSVGVYRHNVLNTRAPRDRDR